MPAGPSDPSDYRKNAASNKEYYRNRPDIVAVYDILVAFNRHHYEALPLSEVRQIYDAEAPALGRLLKPDLRSTTEAYLDRDAPLADEEYKSLLHEWSMLRGYLEDGRGVMPYIVIGLLVLLTMTAIYRLVFR